MKMAVVTRTIMFLGDEPEPSELFVKASGHNLVSVVSKGTSERLMPFWIPMCLIFLIE